MSSNLLFDRQRTWLDRLLHLVQDRAATEERLEEAYRSERAAADSDIRSKRQHLEQRREREIAAAEVSLQRAQREILQRYETDIQANDKQLAETRMKVTEQSDDAEEKARSGLQEATWTATSFFEAGEKEATEEMQKGKLAAAAALNDAQSMWNELDQFLRKCDLPAEEIMNAGKGPRTQPTDPGQTMHNALKSSEMFFGQLRNLLLPKLITVPVGGVMYLVLSVLACLPAIWMKPPLAWLLGGLFAGLLLFVMLRALLKFLSLRQIRRISELLARSLYVAEDAAKRLAERTQAEHDEKMSDLKEKHDRKTKRAESHFLPLIEQVDQRRQFLLTEAGDRHRRQSETLTKKRDDDLHGAEERNWASRADSDSRHENALAEAEAAYAERQHDSEEAYQHGWRELVSLWQDTLKDLRTEAASLRAENDANFPPWTSTAWASRPVVREVPRGVRLGEMAYDLAHISKGYSDDERLRIPPLLGSLPAFVPFPDHCAVLLKARDQARAKSVQVVQSLMLRFLASVPPGKVRFTVLDPVGLGDNFASFMHLCDYDEQLMGARIWTESVQIEQRLADITQHMENVIQKYLRHQFRTIEEYNEAAGEVAEPFRVLVVANFPANFSADAARRLVSIVSSGASCGVFTLITVDPKLPMPHGFNLSDLEQACLNLNWRNDRFVCTDDVLTRFDLSVDWPPDSDTTAQLVHRIGAQAKDANRVEVPFDFVAPSEEKVWTHDSRGGLFVPVGRSGATKQQLLSLGRGTAQHGLIAGKTGSGKSTLLHAIVTNLALHYSPDEVELYLIDFKKGVEFKPYAEYQLPHARVVAIESEREFGLSVLQRLDAELRARGDKFRTAGVNDVATFRAERPNEKLPRILLIVDEFQEFFVEDDKLAQEAALLLDRLVRQGRAFGLHLLLGSQTLGGAYSLARATIDQMAVRIALQCSEADAHLILSKDNAAARLLSRPGEAIYNDSNGLLEGNDLFQVVWLPDERREKILAGLQRRFKSANIAPPLVFEGNAPAEPHRNYMIERLLQARTWPENPRSFSAWLGEAIAIKDPTAAVFRPQSGSNLLMIGQHEEAALAMVSTGVLGLAAQHIPTDAASPRCGRFHMLDGTVADDLNAEFLKTAVDGLPHQVQGADLWTLAPMLQELALEVSQRQNRSSADRSTRYLIIHGLQRFRDLRRAEDDFGMRRGDKPATPAENFATILRDGPSVGVHLIMWCDTLTNVNRYLDRTMLRECTQRVLFQMSATDSSHLIDSPLASRLGRNRALFHREEQEQPEKFRPYGLPTKEWINSVKEVLRRRV